MPATAETPATAGKQLASFSENSRKKRLKSEQNTSLALIWMIYPKTLFYQKQLIDH
jgi:hypothetical protein